MRSTECAAEGGRKVKGGGCSDRGKTHSDSKAFERGVAALLEEMRVLARYRPRKGIRGMGQERDWGVIWGRRKAKRRSNEEGMDGGGETEEVANVSLHDRPQGERRKKKRSGRREVECAGATLDGRHTRREKYESSVRWPSGVGLHELHIGKLGGSRSSAKETKKCRRGKAGNSIGELMHIARVAGSARRQAAGAEQ